MQRPTDPDKCHARHIEEMIAAGVDGYLIKDCPREELLKLIRELTDSGAVDGYMSRFCPGCVAMV